MHTFSSSTDEPASPGSGAGNTQTLTVIHPPSYAASSAAGMEAPGYDPSAKPINVKIIVVGDVSVGKTTLTLRFVADESWNNASTTTGVDLRVRRMWVGGKLVKLSLWDTAGSERFQAISTQYYRGAHGAVLVCDISNRNSFSNLSRWAHEVQKHTNSDSSNSLPRIVVGNKADQEVRAISLDEGETYASEVDALFIETSAVKNTCVQEAFMQLVERILEKEASKPKEHDARPQPRVDINQDGPKEEEESGCGC